MSKRPLKPIDLNLDEPGKDLTRLFASSISSANDQRLLAQAIMLPIERLLDNPYQPRVHMEQASLDELARVIDGQGFQGVLVARPHPDRPEYYQLTAGHRRREAARRTGMRALPVVTRELSNEEMVTLAITENIQRDDLTPLEEGRIYLLMSAEMGYTLEQMSKEVGKTVGYIYNRLRVARAPEDIQALVQEKPDSLRAVANLIKVQDVAERAQIIGQILEGRMTTDDLPTYIKTLDAERPSTPASTPPPHKLLNTVNLDAEWNTPPDPNTQVAPPLETDLTSNESTAEVTLLDGIEMPVEHTKPERIYISNPGEREERARLRVRRSRISRMLNLVLDLSDSVRDGDTLTEEEKLDLATIAGVAGRLCQRFGIEKDS